MSHFGYLDTTFGSLSGSVPGSRTGKVITDFGGDDNASSVAINQTNGKIIVAGYSNVSGTYDFALACYTSDGELDLSFGSNETGKVITDFAGTNDVGGTNDVAISVAINQNNGKIIVAGTVNNNFALACYTSDGELDLSFGSNETGKVITDFGGIDYCMSVAINQTNGNIIVVGYTNVNGTNDFALACYEQSGYLDERFGSAGPGKVITNFGGNYKATSVAIHQTNGNIIVSGYITLNGTNNLVLACYSSTGILDTTFGSNAGVVTTGFTGQSDSFSVAINQTNGNIIVAGTVNGNITAAGKVNGDFALACYTSTGDLDNTFGSNGKVFNDFYRGYDKAKSVAIDNFSGNIIVSGYTNSDSNNSMIKYFLACYTSTGYLDKKFGPEKNGKFVTHFKEGNNEIISAIATSVAINQTNGKIIVAGTINGTTTINRTNYIYENGTNYFALTCYIGWYTTKLPPLFTNPFSTIMTIRSDTNLIINKDYNYEIIGDRIFVRFINPDKECNIYFTQQTVIDVLVVGGGGKGGNLEIDKGMLLYLGGILTGSGGGGGGGVLALDNISANANTRYNIKVGNKFNNNLDINLSKSNFNNYIADPGREGNVRFMFNTASGGNSGNYNTNGDFYGGGLQDNTTKSILDGYGNIIGYYSTGGGGGGGGAGGAGGASISTKPGIGGKRGLGKQWNKDNRFYGFGGPGGSGDYKTMDMEYNGEQYGVGGYGGASGFTKDGIKYNFDYLNTAIYITLIGGDGTSGVVIISYILPPPTLSDFPTIDKTYGDVSFNLIDPTSNSTGTFTFSSSNTAVATISGRTVTIVGAGTTTITATQNTSNIFSGGTTINATLNVGKGYPTIEIIQIEKHYGDAPFILNPNSNSTGTFTFVSSNTSSVTIDGNIATIVGIGSSQIIITQSETDNFYESIAFDSVISVPITFPEISNFEDLNKNLNKNTFTLNPISISTGAFTFTNTNHGFYYRNEDFNTSVATISGNVVTMHKVGTTAIRASIERTPFYRETYKDIMLTVSIPTVDSSSVTIDGKKVSLFAFGEDIIAVVPPKSYEGSSVPISTITSIKVGTSIVTMMT
jgi:uncharacterized delta-60 repeat protein